MMDTSIFGGSSSGAGASTSSSVAAHGMLKKWPKRNKQKKGRKEIVQPPKA